MGDEVATPLNAHLYDFYNDGSVKALLEANRIPRGDLWFLLEDFSLILATVVTAIANFLDPALDADMDLANDGESDHDDDATLVEGFESTPSILTVKSNMNGLKLSNGTGFKTTPSSTPELTTAVKPVAKPKKKKVLDSWDDEESSSESESEEQKEEVDEAVRKAAAQQTERELRKVYRMFKKLQQEFDAKFKNMWA